MILVLDMQLWVVTLVKVGVLVFLIELFGHEWASPERKVLLTLGLATLYFLLDSMSKTKELFDEEPAHSTKPKGEAKVKGEGKDEAKDEEPAPPPAKPKVVRRNADYGLSFMPPKEWKIPEQHPPVCIQEKECPVCPVYTSHQDNLPYSVIVAGLPETRVEVVD